METNQSSGKEEGEENKLILVSAKDEFCLQQDVCAMCGAFGQDQEGRLIACAQCGQCYHPFCANVKVRNLTILMYKASETWHWSNTVILLVW